MPDLISLPTERAEQLRQLAAARKMTMTDLLGEFIREQFAELDLKLTVPGIDVRRVGTKVKVDFGGFGASMSTELAHAYAAALRVFAEPKRKGARGMTQDALEGLSGAHTVGIGRRGTSVLISLGEHRRALAPSIARDLADVIDSAAH